jgi:hypothetical protein
VGERDRRYDVVPAAPSSLQREVLVQDRYGLLAVVDEADLDGRDLVGERVRRATPVVEARDDADSRVEGDGRRDRAGDELRVPSGRKVAVST